MQGKWWECMAPSRKQGKTRPLLSGNVSCQLVFLLEMKVSILSQKVGQLWVRQMSLGLFQKVLK